jgi:hypothetical protein
MRDSNYTSAEPNLTLLRLQREAYAPYLSKITLDDKETFETKNLGVK